MDLPVELTPSRGRYVMRFRSDLATGLYVPGGETSVELTDQGVRAVDEALWDGLDQADRVRVVLGRVRQLSLDPVHRDHILASVGLAAGCDSPSV
jgi:hypothetical protein